MGVAQSGVGQLSTTYLAGGQTGAQMGGKSLRVEFPLVTKPTWTALYWGRDRVFIG